MSGEMLMSIGTPLVGSADLGTQRVNAKLHTASDEQGVFVSQYSGFARRKASHDKANVKPSSR